MHICVSTAVYIKYLGFFYVYLIWPSGGKSSFSKMNAVRKKKSSFWLLRLNASVWTRDWAGARKACELDRTGARTGARTSLGFEFCHTPSALPLTENVASCTQQTTDDHVSCWNTDIHAHITHPSVTLSRAQGRYSMHRDSNKKKNVTRWIFFSDLNEFVCTKRSGTCRETPQSKRVHVFIRSL